MLSLLAYRQLLHRVSIAEARQLRADAPGIPLTENRTKEPRLELFADRTSAATMRANRIRLYFSSIAYTLFEGLRRLGLAGTEMAQAQCGMIRLRLLKIGA